VTRLAILCPGQGAQQRTMFDRLAGERPAEEAFAQAGTVFGQDPRAWLRTAANDAWFENRFAQPLLCTAMCATWAALRAQLPVPAVFAGYSVGELAAYGCAGALDVAETVRLAQERAACMDAASDGGAGLAAVLGLGRSRVDALCGEHGVEIAIINGPDHFILGGPIPRLDELLALVSAQAAVTVRRLPVTVPAHTSWLRAASATFVAALARSALRAPDTPVVAGISGALVRDRASAVATLSAQLSTTVDWVACMQAAYEMGARVFLELGPGTALTRLLREHYADVTARSIDEFHSLQGARDWVRQQLA
jgi:[acyl-carrier-protein] S-malonyltransferase